MAPTPSQRSPEEATVVLLKRLVLFVGFIVLAIVLVFCYFASEFAISIVLSAMLAVLVDPIVAKMQRAHLRRTAASGIVVVVGSLIVVGLAFTFYRRVSSFAAQLPQYEAQLQRELQPVLKKVPDLQHTNWEKLVEHSMGSMRTLLIVAGVVPFLVFFMLVRKEQMYYRAVELFEGSTDAKRLICNLNNALRGLASAYLLVGAGMSVVFCTEFALLRLHDALILGIISGYLNLIPYVGPLFAIVLPFAGAMQQFSSFIPAAIMILTILAVHFTVANVVAPRWIGPRVQIGPAAVLAGMLFWGWLWGILGIVLAIPLTACLKVVADAHPRLSYFSDLLADQLDLPRRSPPG